MLGNRGLTKLRKSFVMIAGLGAVGGYVVEALARAGVGRIRVVDFDVVSESNINRQLYALDNTLGMKKTQVAAERVRLINPNCRIEPLDCFIHTDTLAEVLAGNPDLVIDAIDALNPKVELLTAVSQQNIPSISSMGAALRDDFTKIKYGMLGEVHYCPLAAMLRKRLRRRGLSLDLPCVYSTQPPLRQAVAAPPQTPSNIPRGDNRGRERNILGSLPTITAIFGLVIANQAIKQLLDSKEYNETTPNE